MPVKYFCDKCGKEFIPHGLHGLDSEKFFEEFTNFGKGITIPLLCPTCRQDLKKLINEFMGKPEKKPGKMF